MDNERVSLKDVYDITNRIEGKMDKLSDRISAIELWKAEVNGKVLILTGVFTIFLTFLIDAVKRAFNI
jgi:hypothetical protein